MKYENKQYNFIVLYRFYDFIKPEVIKVHIFYDFMTIIYIHFIGKKLQKAIHLPIYKCIYEIEE